MTVILVIAFCYNRLQCQNRDYFLPSKYVLLLQRMPVLVIRDCM